MIKRRELVIALGATSLTPRVLFAQSKNEPVLVGWLSFYSSESGRGYLALFREGLASYGWKESAQFFIEPHWADGSDDRLTAVTRELAGKKPTVIVSGLKSDGQGGQRGADYSDSHDY